MTKTETPEKHSRGNESPKGKKWKDEFFLEMYLSARNGDSREETARKMGVKLSTLQGWLKSIPALKLCKDRGIADRPNNESVETFMSTAGRRLPPELKKYWDKICSLDLDDEQFEEKFERVIGSNGKILRQQLFVQALMAYNFDVNEACRRVNISQKTLKFWAENDAYFPQVLRQIREVKKNFIENSLFNLIALGDSPATIFAAKTQLRDRGYDPKITIHHKGSIEHTHSSADVDKVVALLSPSARAEFLAAVKQVTRKALPPKKSEEIEDAEFLVVDKTFIKGKEDD